MLNRRQFICRAATAASTTALLSNANAAASIAPWHGSSPNPADLQALLDDTARDLGLVGAQFAIFDGNQVLEFATGKASREQGYDVTTDTLFQIGSTTKVFNAALVMTQVDEEKLDLDKPVKNWIPDFRLADEESTNQVTLRQLLSMSAGVDNGPYTDYGRGDDAIRRYVSAMANVPMTFSPGSAFGYSNASTTIAGFAIQCVTDQTWESLLARHILRPLKLKHSATLAEELLYHSVALGYAHPTNGKIPIRIPNWALPRSLAPAGATLCCSMGDLVRFGRMMLSKGQSESGRQIISESAVATMHSPQVKLPVQITAKHWCAGPFLKQWDGHNIFGHSGTNTGGSSTLLWCPSKNVAIAAATNVATRGYPFADKIFDTVFPDVFGVAKPETPTPDTVTPVPVDPLRYVGKYEMSGNGFSFTEKNDQLVAHDCRGTPVNFDNPFVSSTLIYLGNDRFLPADPAIGGNRGWDVAFWGDDGNGRATHYLNGVMAMRRTG